VQHEALGAVALRGFEWFDWLPQRLTALTFAVVGDFEDALLCWRTQAGVAAGSSILAVAAGAGACGVRLTLGSAELGLGELPDADSLESTEAMLWRAALLWLGALFMIGVAMWLA
jgi:cobalamin biosynthesis protein CobD/CbiB